MTADKEKIKTTGSRMCDELKRVSNGRWGGGLASGCNLCPFAPKKTLTEKKNDADRVRLEK